MADEYPGHASVLEARNRIDGHIHRTPLLHSRSFSRLFGADVYVKAENLQKTGSFKVRGALNKLSLLDPGSKVVAVSMGNHAQGVAYAAGCLGMNATIVMPRTAPVVKVEATRGYGAGVMLHGAGFAEAFLYAREQVHGVFVHPFDDDDVIAGQGTVGCEIADELGTADAVLVPVGGGGLIAGVALVVKQLCPHMDVIGVQSAAADAVCRSFRAGLIDIRSPQPTVADGIAVDRPGERTFAVIRRYVDDMISVAEQSIASAMLLFLERKKLVVEGAGAVGLAALVEHGERFRGKRVVIIASGGNIDFTVIDRIMHDALVASGRIGTIGVVIEGSFAGLQRLTDAITAADGGLIACRPGLGGSCDAGARELTVTLETRGRGHFEELVDHLRKQGFQVIRLS